MNNLIKTERLVLREFTLSDAESIYQLNTDRDVIRYTGDVPFKSVEEATQFLLDYHDYKNNGFGRWAVLLKPSEEFIGWCGLKKHMNYVDLGFRFFKKYWNKGYATEASKACLEYGFNRLKLDEIVGRVSQENIGSIRVLEKIGMSYWKKDTCKGIENALYYRIKNEL